jgi:hypothetical protein
MGDGWLDYDSTKEGTDLKSKLKLLVAIASVFMVVTTMFAGAALATTFQDVAYVSIAGTDLHDAHLDAESDNFKEECKEGDKESLDPGEVLWHFVLTQTTTLNGGLLRTEFDSAGVTDPDVAKTKFVGGVVHWNVVTPTSDTLLNASTDAVGGQLNLSHVCRADTLAAISAITTEIHLGEADGGIDPDVVPITDPLTKIDLGSTVHDSAELTTTPVVPMPADSTITFYFYEDGTCDASFEGDPGTYAYSEEFDATGDAPINVDDALKQGPLEAGQYSYRAFFSSGDAGIVLDATGDCEPFEVDKGDTTILTEVHDAEHNDITGEAVEAGSDVHDKAFVVGDPDTPFQITGDVKFFFFTNGTCDWDGFVDSETVEVVANVPVDNGATAESTPKTIDEPGQYSYWAKYLGDDNYNKSKSELCEPFRVVQHGKTMGFWGNKNGQALLVANGAFDANAVLLGLPNVDATHVRCNVLVNSAAKSKTVFPNTLNGWSLITQCNASTKLDNGINSGSFNVLLSQTLALSYNILYIDNYAGQTIADLGCTAVSPLPGTSTVQAARDQANSLIGNAIKNNGSATVMQGQIGAMNSLLGCLNAEA